MPTDLHYRLTGDSTALERALERGSTSMSKAGREARRLEAEQRRLHQAMSTVGKGMVIAGAAIAAGLALSVRAAVQWESAWAGVLKTVDGTPEQMAALEEEIRALTAVLPASHQEIAAVAEAAGQLGIQRENVAAFTKTMIDMGEATNLSSDEAATAIARFMNIMQSAPEDVDRLASAIVDLGNKGATTESEITEMALRIAGAGRTIGLSEQQVLGFAAALSNVGIRAEAGGTAISKVFLEIDTAVSSGGDTLNTFAETAGMSADQFKQAYERDAGGAIAAFVAGLAKVQSSGGDVNAILSELGLTNIRVSDALRRLAGSGTNLADALDLSNKAWDENTALMAEAERRYGTTAAQAAIARNQVNDFAIDIGQSLLPAVRDVVGSLSAMLEILRGLPGPVKTALGIIAGLTAAVLLMGGAYLLAVPRIIAAKGALDTWAASAARGATAARGLSAALGFLAGPWGLAIAAAATVATVAFGAYANRQAEARAASKEFASTLDELTGAITQNSRAFVAHKLLESDAIDAADRLGISTAELVDIVLEGEGAMRALDEATGGTGASWLEAQSIWGKAGQVLDEDAKALAVLQREVKGVSGEVTAGQAVWEALNEAEDENLSVTDQLSPAQRDLASAFDATADTAEGVAGAVDDLDEELKQLFDRVFGLQNAEDDLADAFDALTEKIQEQRDAGVDGAGSLDGMSEAARENRDLAQDLLEKFGQVTLETIKMTGSEEEALEVAKDFKKRLEDLAEETGTNVEELEGYNDVVAEIERLIEITFQTDGVTAAENAAERIRNKLANIDRTVTISFRTEGFAPVGSTRIPGLARGGQVVGPRGTDLVPAMLTEGEFVVRRDMAQRHLGLLSAINSGRLDRAVARPAGLTDRQRAAEEILRAIRSGKQFFEDFTFRGASANVKRFNDQLADQFYSGGRQFNRQAIERFLRDVAKPAQAVPTFQAGRWPVSAMGGGMPSSTGAAGMSGGGTFVGNLFLDSGEFLGRVRGEVRQGLAAQNWELRRRLDQQVGAVS